MGTTYEYTYEYEVADSNKHNRNTANTGSHTQRTAGHQSNYTASHATLNRASGMDPLINLQKDRIWHKLYDPPNSDKSSQETEAQKMARRQDRKVIKIEAAYGSDRQTIIVKRNYDLRVRDVQEDASKIFKMPVDQIILYWKGRNICDTPNELLETLGIENNHTMRVCREDDPAQQNRRRELRSYATNDQQYPSSNDMYKQQQPYQQQQQPPQQYYSQYQQPSQMYDQQQQQQYGTSPRDYYNRGCTHKYYPNCDCCCHHGSANYQSQMANPNVQAPVAPTFVLNLQIGFGDRLEGLVIGRPHPITIYDLQVELQQRFQIPVLEQNVSHNGMPLTQFPPDASLDTLGILNNSFISLWYRNPTSNTQQQQQQQPQQQPPSNEYYSSRQQPQPQPQQPLPPPPPTGFHGDQSQPPYGGNAGNYNENSPRRIDSTNNNDPTQNGNNQDVLKIEVFHGSDRHVLILRSSNNLRISDLMEELQRITSVPVQNQKLYFRGQELQQYRDRTLREAGIDNNAQVRLIGDPTKSRYEAMISGNRN